ncbi:tetratricopeptide repeat protein [Tengunoibacter tsumagoiensis]|nr:tetratricopeptide repeat protein [Tengunoibacter tsumagoiensis]
MKAEYAITLHKYELALELVQMALSQIPESSVAHYTMARILLLQRRFEAAEVAFVETLRLDPNNDLAHMLYATLLQELKRASQAEQEYKIALELNPQSADAHFYYSQFLLMFRNAPSTAKIHCLKVLTLEPMNAAAYAVLGQIATREDEIPEAEAAYLKALSLDPENPTIHNSYGVFLCDKKRNPKSALAHFRIALMKDPKDEGYKHNLLLALKVSHSFYWLFWRFASLRHYNKGFTLFFILTTIILVRTPWFLAQNDRVWLPIAVVSISIFILFMLYIFTINPLLDLCLKKGWIR